MPPFEVEQKFKVKNIRELRAKLVRLRASKRASGQEVNEFWDREGSLRAEKKALRLRKFEGRSLVTVKGPLLRGRYSRRLEIEIPIPLEIARPFLKELGFQKVWGYSKYREEYLLGKALVTLDRLEKEGWFLEIEAPASVISRVMLLLGLSPSQRESRTYSQILNSANFPKGKRTP